jgi:hypothetical protein
MQRHQLMRREFIADWRPGGIAARGARSSAQSRCSLDNSNAARKDKHSWRQEKV